MNRRSWRLGLLSILSTVLLAPGMQATPLSVVLDIQGQGLNFSEAGVGLQGIRNGTRFLTVEIGGPVQSAVLYWTGRDRPCPLSGGTCTIPFQPYKDQVLRLDGALVIGTVVGTETQPVSGGGPINNIGYMVDVTSIVQTRGTGFQTFAIEDANTSSNLFRLNGAGLLVVYTDPVDTAQYRLMVFRGLDFAYGADPTPGPTRVTEPITFQHGAHTSARTAKLRIFSGDAVESRPDRIDISNHPSLIKTLDGSDGPSWDTDAILLSIPAGVASTTAQLFSSPPDSHPDSLLWILAALRLPLPGSVPSTETAGCTPGYWKDHATSWPPTGYSPDQIAGSVFSGASAFPSLASRTLLQSLQGGGGSGTTGAARILLRAAVAALLNASHSGVVDFPRTTAEILADVSSALASNSRDVMLKLARELDHDNSLGCPLS